MDNLNLFWRQSEGGLYKENEKENNVTHAFLVLLKENTTFRKELFRQVFSEITIDKDAEVISQVNKKERYRTLETEYKRILIVKSKYVDKMSKSEIKKKKNDRPDGLIIDRKNAILIEAKVSSKVDNTQIQRYNKQFFGSQAQEKVVDWEQIVTIATKFKKKNGKLKSDFVLSHFIGYLEGINLAGFNGIPFFKKGEMYDFAVATYVLKRLIVDLKETSWFEEKKFRMGNRPKTGNAWDYFCSKKIKGDNPRKFPHYSLYVFQEFFGIDVLFHSKEIRKVLKNDKLRSDFMKELYLLSKKSSDYFFKIVAYRKLANKKKGVGVQIGPDYENVTFCIQLNRFIERHSENWQDILGSYIELLLKEDPKQLSILKKYHYKDRQFSGGIEDLSDPKKVIGEIKKTVDETFQLHKLTLDIYK